MTNNGVVNGPVAANGQTLQGSGSYSSTVTLNGGTLIPGSIAAASGVAIGGNLSITGGLLDLVFSGTASSTMTLLGSASFTSDMSLSIIQLMAPTLSSYQIFNAAGGISGLTGGFLETIGRTTYSVDPGELASNVLQIDISGSANNLVWGTSTGSGDGQTWEDQQLEQNWTNVTRGGSADYFYDGDNVTFNDNNLGRYTVTILNTVSPGAMLVTGTGAYTIGNLGSIIGPGSLTVTDSNGGSLTLNEANSYFGGTTLNGGTLYLGNSSAIGTGALTINGGTIDNSSGSGLTLSNTNAQVWAASFTFGGTNPLNLGSGAVTISATSPTITIDNGSTLEVDGAIGGIGLGLTLSGSGGTLTLGGTSTYTGATTVNNGTTLNITGALGNTPVTVNSGGTITLANAGAINQNILTIPAGAIFNEPTTDGLGGTAGLAVVDNTVTLSQSNSYTGPTTLTSGTLLLNANGAIGSGLVTFTSGTVDNTSGGPVTMTGNPSLNWNGNFTFIGSNNLNLGAGPATLAANTGITILDPGAVLAVGGVISGTNSLTVLGSGTLQLLGANAYSGATIINPGAAIEVGNGSNATAQLGGATVPGSASQVTDNGLLTFDFNGSPANGFLNGISGDGSLTLPLGSADYSIKFDGSNAGFTGSLTIGPNARLQVSADVTGYSGSDEFSNASTITVQAGGQYFIDNTGDNAIFNGSWVLSGTQWAGDGGAPEGTLRIDGTTSILGSVTLGSTILLDVGAPTTISGAITDSGSGYTLLKTGGQTLLLTNTGNNYGGGTMVDQGTLQLGANNALPTSGTLTLGYSGASAGALVAGAPGTLDLNGFNQTVGGLVNSGTGISVIGNSSTASSGTLTFAGSLGVSSTFGGLIQDILAAGTQKTALKVVSGSLVLTGSDTFSGPTTVQGGIINYQNGTAFGVSSAITVEVNATAQVQGGISGGSQLMLIAGNGAAGQGATGALESVSGTNSYLGAITMTANSTISSNSGDLILDGIIGDGGNGYELITTGLGTITLNGADSFTGATIIEEGIVDYENGAAFGTSSAITADNGATAQVQGGIVGGGLPLTIGGVGAAGSTGVLESVSGNNSYSGPITLGANTTISTDTGTLTLSGSIGDGGNGYALTTAGAGLTKIAGIATYTGSTSVTKGTLDVTGSLNGSSSVTVTDAALEGTGYIAMPVTIGNGINSPDTAILEPGAVGAVGTLTTGSSVSLMEDADFIFDINSTGGGAGSGASELIAAAVSLNSSAQFTFQDIASGVGTLNGGMVIPVILAPSGLSGEFGDLAQGAQVDDGPNTFYATYTPTELTLTVIPEPGTWGMLLGGLGMLIGFRRIRRRSGV